jgi:DsbC/DsbD-like thiol-disulfide interchange protein
MPASTIPQSPFYGGKTDANEDQKPFDVLLFLCYKYHIEKAMIKDPARLTEFILLGYFMLCFIPVHGSSLPQHAKAQLIAEVESIEPDSHFCVILALTMDEGWHTYWQNPGDSGLPTTIKWDLPEGFAAGEIQWPYPQKLDNSGIVSFGYTRRVFLLVDMKVPSTAKAGTVVRFSARVDWLACKEECLPERADLVMELPVKDQKPDVDTKWAGFFEVFRNNLPKVLDDWSISAFAEGEKVVIKVLPHHFADKPPIDIYFFPEKEALVDHSAAQKVDNLRNGYSISMKRSRFSSTLPSRLKGILYSTQGWDVAGKTHALFVDVPLEKKE